MQGVQMSANLRDEEFNKSSNYERTFKPVRRMQDPRFGEVNLLSNPGTKEQVIVRERKYNDKAEAARAILAARARMANQTPYGLKLLDYSATKQSELCSTIYIVRQFWEFPGTDLRREFTQRQSNNTAFTEAELSNILYNMIKANATGLHGDVSPTNISYDRATGIAKLIDRSEELPSVQRTINIQKNKVVSNQPLYQSPNMYSNLKKNNLKFNIDPSKEDAFALGLTMLELGNLKPVNNIYDASRREVDRTLLARHLEDFKVRYPNSNSFLVNMVNGLTQYDENSRLGLREAELNLPSETDFRSRIGTGTFVQNVPGTLTTTTTTIGGNTANMGGLGTTTTNVTVNTTPIPPPQEISIYSAQTNAGNPFYKPPAIPPINIAPIPIPNFTYNPPVVVEEPPRTNVVVVKNDPAPLTEVKSTTVTTTVPPPVTIAPPPVTIAPAPTTITNTTVIAPAPTTDYVRHEFRTGGSVIEPPVVHDYKGMDTSFSSTRSYDSYGSYGRYAPSPAYGETYTSTLPRSYSDNYIVTGNAAPYGSSYSASSNRIVLEPEVRTTYVNAPLTTTYSGASNIVQGGYIEQPVAYAAAPQIAYAAAPQVVYTSTIPETYTTTAIPAVSNIATTYTTGSILPGTVISAAPTYTSVIPTETIATSYAPRISTQPIITSGTVITTPSIASNTIISTAPAGVISENTSVSGLKLVKTYQDPKFSTDVRVL